MSNDTASQLDGAFGYTEASATWSIRYIDPSGFECLLSIQAETGAEALRKAEVAITHLTEAKCIPYYKEAKLWLKVLDNYEISSKNFQNQVSLKDIDMNDPVTLMTFNISKALLYLSMMRFSNYTSLKIKFSDNDILSMFILSEGIPPRILVKIPYYTMANQEKIESMRIRGWKIPPKLYEYFIRTWEKDADLLDIAREIFIFLDEVYKLSPLQELKIR